MQCVAIVSASAAALIQFTPYDITALQTLGCEIHMICPQKHSAVSEFALSAFRKRFPHLIWHEIPFADSLSAVRQNGIAKKQLIQLLTELKPDLLHCHGTIAGKYGRAAAAQLHIPVCYTAHDFRIFRGCTLAERLWFSGMEQSLSKHTDVMFTVCAEDTAYAKKHLHPKALQELPLTGSMNSSDYASPKRSAAEVRHSLQIPEDAVVLLSVGTLRMQKRLRIVLQAMTRLRELPQLHYIICGDGPDRLFLEKLIEKLHLTQRVHLLGYRTDVPDLLGAADIFCIPSRREGCAHSAMEAMAAGLPLITVRSHGIREFVDEDGAVFLKGDLVRACADAIASLTENRLLRKQMGAHNRAAAAGCSAEERMMLMREQYRRLLKQSQS